MENSRPFWRPVIVALHSKEDDRPKIRYSQRCEDLFRVQARLGPKVMPLDETTGNVGDVWTLRYKALIFSYLGRYGEAIKLLDKAISVFYSE